MPVFAYRHDWAAPLIERLEWRTAVVRSVSGAETRRPERLLPRRRLVYTIGHGNPTDAQAADWLTKHLGQAALWPMPQYAAILAEPAPQGATELPLREAGWLAMLLREPYYDPDPEISPATTEMYELAARVRELVIYMPGGDWQAARADDELVHTIGQGVLHLASPLARAAPAGSLVTPLAEGYAVDACELALPAPGLANGQVAAELGLADALAPSHAAPDDPLLDGRPVWPEGDWRDDPVANVQAVAIRQDFSPAVPWVWRDDPAPDAVFRRRYLIHAPETFDRWMRRLWRAHGRLRSFYVPDGLAPPLRTVASGLQYLRVTGLGLFEFWTAPAPCLIIRPDGGAQAAMTQTASWADGGTLILRDNIGQTPAGSRIVRLMHGRLDHDAVELHWLHRQLVEISLSFRQLPT